MIFRFCRLVTLASVSILFLFSACVREGETEAILLPEKGSVNDVDDVINVFRIPAVAFGKPVIVGDSLSANTKTIKVELKDHTSLSKQVIVSVYANDTDGEPTIPVIKDWDISSSITQNITLTDENYNYLIVVLEETGKEESVEIDLTINDVTQVYDLEVGTSHAYKVYIY